MNKRGIWVIIILMSTAMIGLSVLQFIWINRQIKLGEQQFKDKVFTTLGEVKQKLEEDAIQNLSIIGKKKGALFANESDKIVSQIMKKKSGGVFKPLELSELKKIPYLINPETKLEEINNENLDEYLKKGLEAKGVQLNVEYGVFSKSSESFISVNGHYVVDIEGGSSEIGKKETRGLKNTQFSIDLFDEGESSPGSLKLFFPGYNSFLLSSVWILLLCSLLFTGLVMFCFGYVIYVVFRQKQVSEMKTDFINNMTHEFKTPIATISLASDSILSPSIIENKDKITRFANIIKQENRRMLAQVEKVLQMARIDKKEFELNISDVHMHTIISTAVENSNLKVSSRGGSIVSKLNASNDLVQGDSNHIANMMNNLLDNAEKYSPESPKIIVETKNIKQGFLVEITDHGVGMSKEAQKQIFEKFYRVHTGNRHDVKGFGLGLSYVKALISAHKGTITVNSELGKGSTFKLIFPHSWSDKS